MQVRGTHFTAALPSGWTEDTRGTPSGGLRFLDARYREATFAVIRVETRAGVKVEALLRELVAQKAQLAQANGARHVSEPECELGERPSISLSGAAMQPGALVVFFEAVVTHAKPREGAHVIVTFGCYEYFPLERANEGPPNSYAATAFAKSVLATIELANEAPSKGPHAVG